MQRGFLKLRELVSSYGAAVSTARRKGEFNALQALQSVLLSRFRYGFGPRFYSLFEFYGKPQADWKNYLLDESLKVVLRRINPLAQRDVVNDKIKFAEHCVRRQLDAIPVVCSIDRARAKGARGVEVVRTEDEWFSLIGSGPDELFFKLIDGTWGVKAFSAKLQSSGEWSFCGRSGSARDLYAFAMSRLESDRGWLVQPRIRPHQTLQKVMSPKGLGTLRIVTLMRKGVPEIVFSVLRIPVGENQADNLFHGASGNLVAAVDLITGCLDKARASASRSWPIIVDVDEHPETGFQISGVVVPFWSETKALVLRAHRSLPGLVTLGWDVAVTDGGPLLVEANATYDVDLLQVALRRGVRSDIECLF